MGGVTVPLPFGATVEVQLASSFVNRVSPANVGGMALNVRFLQKAGVDSAEAVTGVGLNSLVGAVVHVVLMVAFLAWAGRGGGSGFSIPSSSTVLVVLAVVLAIVGIAMATRRGRLLVRTKVLDFLRRSWTEHLDPGPHAHEAGRAVRRVDRRDARLHRLARRGGVGFHGGVSIAEVGAVYLGASIVASAAPTPGGLGAMEAALVAGFTGVGMDPGTAVAAVLAYRLVTYWVPILPGWLSFRELDHRGLI